MIASVIAILQSDKESHDTLGMQTKHNRFPVLFINWCELLLLMMNPPPLRQGSARPRHLFRWPFGQICLREKPCTYAEMNPQSTCGAESPFGGC
jgi:hypothetical protein